MTTQKHLRAVNRAIKAAALDEEGIDAPLSELLRDLARKMDRSDGEPSDRLLAAYLSATKDLARSMARRPKTPPVPQEPAPSAAPGGPPALHVVEESPLAKLRRKDRANSAQAS